MLYTIMVVDDEKTIRQNISKLLPFDEEGFQFCEAASNGQDALEKYELYQPDLILLDISMPIMDGLAFLKEIRERGNQVKVIILSGFSDFQYAVSAMRYGVVDYLTKPVDEQELLTLLRKVKVQLDEEHSERAESSLREQIEILKKLYHNGNCDRDLLSQYFLLHCVVIERQNNQPEINLLKSYMEEEFSWANEGMFRFRGGVYTYLLSREVLADYDGEILFAKHIQYFLKQQGVQTAILMDYQIFMPSEDAFRIDFDIHLYKMLSEVFYGTKTIAVYEKNESEKTVERPLNQEAELFENFKNHYLSQNKEAVDSVLKDIFEGIKKHQPTLEIIQQITYRSFYLLQELSDSVNDLESIDWREQNEFLTFEKWKEKVVEVVNSSYRIMKENLAEKQKSSGKDVVAYVNQHFKESITLGDVAEHFHMNAAYLGRQFQKNTEVSFKQYINDLRIEEAKKLLLNSNKMIYEIAEEVGFSESKYFVTKFMDYTGESPSEFRKNLKKE